MAADSYSTPRTDALLEANPDKAAQGATTREYGMLINHARQLERELAAMTMDRDARAREACTLEGRTGCSYARHEPEHGDASEILRALIGRHFDERLTWSYIEDTSLHDVDDELATRIAEWMKRSSSPATPRPA